jgi:UrcA family protein
VKSLPFAIGSKSVLLAATAALGVGSLGLAGSVMAQTVGEVTVVAPHVVRETVGRSPTGTPIEMVTLSRQVGYGDLDLTKASDVQAFKDRVNETAKQACAQIDSLYPLGMSLPDPANANCVAEAAAGGLAQVDMVMAVAAGKK